MDIIQAIRDHAGKADAIVSKVEAEGRQLSRRERAEVTAELAKCAELKEQHRSATAIQSQLAQFTQIGAPPAGSGQPQVNMTARPAGTPGQAFIGSNAYRALLGTRGSDSKPWASRRVATDPVQVTGLWHPRNDLVTGSSEDLLGAPTTSAGVLVQPDHKGIFDSHYARELRLRDLVTTLPTVGDTIEYARVASVTNAAAAVAEATTSAAPTAPPEGGPLVRAAGGGYKPESAIVFEQVQDHVRTIAHTLPVTKKALADAAQLRILIDVFLRYGLDETVEDLMIAGDGTGENFLGLLDASREQSAPGVLDGVQVYTVGTSGDGLLEVARRLKTRAKLGRGGAPTAYVASPLTVERYELLKDAEDRFYVGGPFAGSTEEQLALWRLPFVSCEGVPEDLLLCGNFAQAVFFDREQASITASDSHEDFFIRNLVMILAEMRGGFGVLWEPAFAKTDISGL